MHFKLTNWIGNQIKTKHTDSYDQKTIQVGNQSTHSLQYIYINIHAKTFIIYPNLFDTQVHLTSDIFILSGNGQLFPLAFPRGIHFPTVVPVPFREMTVCPLADKTVF